MKRIKRVGSAFIFAASFIKQNVQRRFVNDLLDLFGGSAVPVMAHLIEAGKLTLADLKQAEKQLSGTKGRQ